MTNTYFPNNEYHTADNTPRKFWDKILMGSSIYFNFKFLKTVFSNRKLAIANKYDRSHWAQSSFEVFKLIENCGGRFHIEGFDNIEAVKDEPVVFICNHQGTMETMIFPGLIAPFKEVTFVIKDNLTTNKVFGPIINARNPIAVSRGDSRNDLMKVLNDGKQKLSEGTSVIIFPQSTRTINFEPENFNSLGVKLAAKSGVKVIPVAIKTDFWLNGKLVKDLGNLDRKQAIHIKFDKPLEIVGNGKEQHQYIVEFIGTHLLKWNKS